MNCPACGKLNPPGSTYCADCGSALTGQRTVFPGHESVSPGQPTVITGQPTVASVPTTGLFESQQTLAGRYVIHHKIADGGFSAVYQAEDTRLGNRLVAVKEMVIGAHGTNPNSVQQAVSDFQQEAELLARIVHPNLPRVIDRFEEAGRQFLVMDYVTGRTLRQVLNEAQTAIPESQVLAWAAQLCDVLHFLHGQQPPIIYRDLKPENVMLQPDGALKLIDFGIARFYKPGKTGDTTMLGTPGYAAPEQFGRGQSDARTDMYALGVMLYALLTGYDVGLTPFRFPPIRQLNRNVSSQTEAALARAMQQDPAARFASMTDFKQALGLGAPSTTAGLAPTPRLPALGTPITAAGGSRNRWLIPIVALLGGATLVGAILAFVWLRSPEPPSNQTAGVGELGAATSQAQAGATAPADAPDAPVVVATEPPVATPSAPPTPTSTSVEAALPPASTPEPSPTPTAPPTTTTPPLPTATTIVIPLPVEPAGVSASGNGPEGVDACGNANTYEAQRAVDGQAATAWRVEGDGVGAWLELQFSEPINVTRVSIIPGFDKIDPCDGTDRFFQGRVVRRVRLEFDSGQVLEAALERTREMQQIPVPDIQAQRLRIVILQTDPPSATDGRDNTAISEVDIRGYPAN